jgi:ParB family chromosome partitioning protein
MRAPARAEAAEMAALCGADLRRHWTPDVQFLRVHTRAQLTAMLEAMEVDVARVSDLSKHELVDRVAEEAAARAWAPASLVWAGDASETPTDDADAAVAEG